jgi:hypothetical protein
MVAGVVVPVRLGALLEIFSGHPGDNLGLDRLYTTSNDPTKRVILNVVTKRGHLGVAPI